MRRPKPVRGRSRSTTTHLTLPGRHIPGNRRRSAWRLALAFCLAAALPLGGHAADDSAHLSVGRILIAAGSVTADRTGESTRGLGRNDSVYEGDVVETGSRGRAQIRFSDGGLVDLEPNTEFEVSEYRNGDDGGRVVFNFLRGALRTLTGAIGGANDTYRMTTSTATISVSGTGYALRYCDAACVEAGGEPGLYGRVDDGAIQVDGPGGNDSFSAGQHFFLPEGGAALRILAPPDGVLDGILDGGDADGDGDEATIADIAIRPLEGDDQSTAGLGGTDDDLFDPAFEQADTFDQAESGEPGEPGEPRFLFGAAFHDGESLGALTESAFIESSAGEGVDLQDDRVISADFPDSGLVDASAMTFEDSGTTVTSADGVAIEWGRWMGSVAVEGEGEGTGPADGGFVYAYTDLDNLTPSSALSGLSHSFTSVSGPDGVGSFDGPWSLSAFDLSVDFGTGVTGLNTFDLAGIGDTIELRTTPASGSLDAGSSSVSVVNIDLIRSNNDFYSGTLQGKFVGDSGQALIIRYDLDNDFGPDTITGIAIVE